MTFFRLLFSAAMGGALGWAVWRFDRQARQPLPGQPRYQSFLAVNLPLFVIGLTGLSLLILGPQEGAKGLLAAFGGLFVHIGAYYLLLALALPLLRRYFSALACGTLWLLPNFLYFTALSFMTPARPAAVLRLPAALAPWLAAVWAAGFGAVLAGRIAAHFVFRARILKDARPVTDPETLAIWEAQLQSARVQKAYPLVASPAVATPLSIGLFPHTIRVVLPLRRYDPEETALLLRHELVHIARQDAWTKFFFAFCGAVFWFFPPFRLALRKSAEDLELSCDELALLGAGEPARRRYAGLLLAAAGEERGFTTCLSAGAKSLRYRLKSVVKPRKKLPGAALVGLAFFALAMTSGYLTFAYTGAVGAGAIYGGQGPESVPLRSVQVPGDGWRRAWRCTDEAALAGYLAGLPLDELAGGQYDYGEEDGREWVLLFDEPEGTLGVLLYDDVLKVVRLYQDGAPARYYLPPDGLDWPLLESLIRPDPALDVALLDKAGERVAEMHATPWRLTREVGGVSQALIDPPEGVDAAAAVSGAVRHDAAGFRLEFSTPPAAWRAAAAPLDGGGEIALAAEDGGYTLPLLAEPALYRVTAEFGTGHGRFTAEFRFTYAPA